MTQTLTTVLLWLAATLLVNLLAHRSQVDAWCEKQPRLAAVLKVLRGLGLDPWLIVQGVSLMVRGRLPKGVSAAPPGEDGL